MRPYPNASLTSCSNQLNLLYLMHENKDLAFHKDMHTTHQHTVSEFQTNIMQMLVNPITVLWEEIMALCTEERVETQVALLCERTCTWVNNRSSRHTRCLPEGEAIYKSFVMDYLVYRITFIFCVFQTSQALVTVGPKFLQPKKKKQLESNHLFSLKIQ